MSLVYGISSQINPITGKPIELFRYDPTAVLIPRKYFEQWEPKEDGTGEWKRYYQGFSIQASFSAGDPPCIDEGALPSGQLLSAKLREDGLKQVRALREKINALNTLVMRCEWYLKQQGK